MPNLNYRAGARLEYGRRKHWMKRGFTVVRSAGSHGIWDLCGIRAEDPSHPVMLIQCKKVDKESQAKTIIRKFKENPPLLPSPHYQMIIEVHVKGVKDVLSATV